MWVYVFAKVEFAFLMSTAAAETKQDLIPIYVHIRYPVC